MPKIVINEIDKTKAGLPPYSNFAVLVPGFRTHDDSAFDDNGVYECSSQADFKKNIGLCYACATMDVEARSAKEPQPIAVDWTDYTQEDLSDCTSFLAVYGLDLTEEDFDKISPDELPTPFNEYVSYKSFVEGYRTIKRANDRERGYRLYKSETNNSTANLIGPQKSGIIYSNTLKYVPYSLALTQIEAFSEGTTLKVAEILNVTPMAYYVFDTFAEEGDEGYMGDTAAGESEILVSHFGNQIAYELLGLGYTVLYKDLGQFDPKFVNDETKNDEALSVITNGFAMLAAADTTDASYADFWTPLKDKATYDFRYVVTGLMDNAGAANTQIIDLATSRRIYNNINEYNFTDEGRGDCIALIDIDRSCYTATGAAQADVLDNIIANANEGTASPYVAYLAPTVTYAMADEAVTVFGGNKTFPAYFHYLACAAKAFQNYSEWYAVAGYTRGISDYAIESVGYKFGEVAIQTLAPRNSQNTELTIAVNLVAKIKSNYILWGNRTGAALEQTDLRASHFLNIRQLCTTIKKQVYVSCRRYTFDPNSDVLWINFRNSLRPMLEKMKADQGINDYKIVKRTYAAGETPQKGLLEATIRIVPVEAVEDFILHVTLEDSLNGIAVAAIEEE